MLHAVSYKKGKKVTDNRKTPEKNQYEKMGFFLGWVDFLTIIFKNIIYC